MTEEEENAESAPTAESGLPSGPVSLSSSSSQQQQQQRNTVIHLSRTGLPVVPHRNRKGEALHVALVRAIAEITPKEKRVDGRFVVGDVVCYYMSLLNYFLQRDNQVHQAYCFDSQNVAAVLGDTKNALRGDIDHINTARYLVFPRNKNGVHWWLEVLDQLSNTLYRFNSSPKIYDDRLWDWMEKKTKKRPTFGKEGVAATVQRDQSSCGYYLIAFAMVITEPGWWPGNDTLSRVLEIDDSDRQVLLDRMDDSEVYKQDKPRPRLNATAKEQHYIDTINELKRQLAAAKQSEEQQLLEEVAPAKRRRAEKRARVEVQEAPVLQQER